MCSELAPISHSYSIQCIFNLKSSLIIYPDYIFIGAIYPYSVLV